VSGSINHPTATHKTLDILLLFREKRLAISVEDISQLLDIPRSTVYRYVRVLCDKGFLEKTNAQDYRLGLAFLELSRNVLASNRDIRLTALPAMKRIAEEVHESVSLMRLYHRQAICIESIEGRHALRVTIERGRTQPLHAGASSKLLLAYMDENDWPDHVDLPLKRFTHTTPIEFDQLKVELHTIREQGYSISVGELDTGAVALAVPLVNQQREVIAALSIEAPESRMDEATMMAHLAVLRREAANINRELR
jgi:IclR family KDG regulon transcriptional repressor